MSSEHGYKLVIDSKGGISSYWKDIWMKKELFGFLAWKDIIVRYKQTSIGIAWSVLRPLISMLILSFVFGVIAKVPSNGLPFPVLIFSGLLGWNFFANSFGESSNSLIVNTNLLTKVYFPRLIIPTSTVVVNLIDMGISLLIFIGLLIVYQIPLRWEIIFAPLFFMFTFITALGGGYLVSALNVKYRDFKYVVPFVTQLGYFLSPIGYLSTSISSSYNFMGYDINLRMLYYFNPITATIDGFRWAFFGGQNDFIWWGLLISGVVSILIFVFGFSYFRKMELSFADDV